MTAKQARIYHNPMCSKSRGALTLLHANGYEVEEIRYLETPPSVEQLDQLCQLLNCQAIDIIRTNEVLFQAMGLNVNDDRDHQAWLEILSSHPKLIQRPIVVIDEQAVMARPPEEVTQLFP